MKSVDTIISEVYGSTSEAASRLGVKRSATWNWRAWGYFPARLAVPIFEHAREKGYELDISEIPTMEKAKQEKLTHSGAGVSPP